MRIFRASLLVGVSLAMIGACGAPGANSPPSESPPPPPAIFLLLDAGARPVAYSWGGSPVMIPHFPAGYLVAQSPDGRFVAIGDGVYSVESGQRVGTWPTKGSAVFASTGALACGVRDGAPAAVNVFNATEYLWLGDKKVRAVGTNSRFGRPEIIACSIKDGFAIVRESGLIPNPPVTAYRLSDGKQLGRVATNGAAVASPDGRLLAVSLPGPVLGIFSMPEGKRVGTVPIPGSPIGFSGDGSLIAVTLPTTPRFESFVVEWPTGTTVWTHIDGVAVLASKPKGAALIVMTPEVGRGPHEVWLVRAPGSPVRLEI